MSLSWMFVTLERNVRRPLAKLRQPWAALQHFWEPSVTVVRAASHRGEKTQGISVCGALTQPCSRGLRCLAYDTEEAGPVLNLRDSDFFFCYFLPAFPETTVTLNDYLIKNDLVYSWLSKESCNVGFRAHE